jgi:hypothetical protein
MRLARHAVLLALVLAATAAAIAVPAFATPNITASSGTRAVAPFVTPIGNTLTSSSTAFSTDSRFGLGGAEFTCRTASMTGYVAATHTQLRLTSVTFGDGRGSTCFWSGGWTFDGDSINGGASSVNPWHLHFKTHDAPTRSGQGTINISRTFSFVITTGTGASCDFTVAGGQSLATTYTYSTTSLAVDGSFTVGIRGITDPLRVCPAGGTMTLRATYTIRPTTASHRLTVTSAS